MSSKYKFHNPDGIYFVTFAVVRWVDVFTRDVYREIILDSLKYCQKEKDLRLHAYVIMTNHLHMIISRQGKNLLENIMRDFKKFTSSALIKAIKENPYESRKEWMIEIFETEGRKNPNNKYYQFWRQDNHPIELTSNRMMDQKLDYLHNNPVEQGFVNRPEDYPWSSMANYIGEKGMIEIDNIM
ncbi:MAG: transposase [Chlorobi bacterium]|nr:transposase [Chlorobiota bacterium]